MKEYIEREATLNKIKELQSVCGCAAYDKDQVEDTIFEIPAADVVEVVRCKDCRHAREMSRREKQLYLKGCVMCSQIDINGEQNPMLPDDFCSYGERKDGVDNGSV